MLIPREIVLCSSQTCLLEASQAGFYSLIEDTKNLVNGSEPSTETHNLINFNERWSILAPKSAGNATSSQFHTFSSIKQLSENLVLPFLWLFAVAVPGMLLISSILPNWRWLSRFFLGLTLGLGIVSFELYLILLVTISSSTGLILGATGLWWGLAGLATYLSVKRSGIGKLNLLPTFKFDPVEIAIIVIGLLMAYISIGKSYWGTDGIVLWAAKGLWDFPFRAVRGSLQLGDAFRPLSIRDPDVDLSF